MNARSISTTVPAPRLPLLATGTCRAASGFDELSGVGGTRQAAAHDRLPALGLVHRQVDALREELAEGLLEAFAADQPLQVAELAARVAGGGGR